MATNNHIECIDRLGMAKAEQHVTFARLQTCCNVLLQDVDHRRYRTVELSNVQQLLKQLSLEKRHQFIDAWNAWIEATAHFKYVSSEKKSLHRSKVDSIGLLTICVFFILIMVWIDRSEAGSFAKAVLLLGLLSLTLTVFPPQRDAHPTESIIRARLIARAVAWHVQGWRLHEDLEGFVSEIYPWRYDSESLRINAPRLKVKLVD